MIVTDIFTFILLSDEGRKLAGPLASKGYDQEYKLPVGYQCIPQELQLGSVLLNAIKSRSVRMSVRIECLLSTSVDDICLEAVADMFEGRAALQKDFNKLEQSIGRNLINFNKDKQKVLSQGWNDPMQQCRIETVDEKKKSTWDLSGQVEQESAVCMAIVKANCVSKGSSLGQGRHFFSSAQPW